MDSVVHSLYIPSSHLHLHHPFVRGSRPRQNRCWSCWKHFSLVNWYHIFFLSVIHLPNVPASTEQEQDHCLPCSSFNFTTCFPVMAFDCSVQVRAQRCTHVNAFGILDSKLGPDCFYHDQVPWHMDRFLILGLQRSLACYQAFPLFWSYVMVRF